MRRRPRGRRQRRRQLPEEQAAQHGRRRQRGRPLPLLPPRQGGRGRRRRGRRLIAALDGGVDAVGDVAAVAVDGGEETASVAVGAEELLDVVARHAAEEQRRSRALLHAQEPDYDNGLLGGRCEGARVVCGYNDTLGDWQVSL